MIHMLWFSVLYVASEIVGRVFTSQNDMRTLHQSVRLSLWDVKTRPTISNGSSIIQLLHVFIPVKCCGFLYYTLLGWNCGTCFHVPEWQPHTWFLSNSSVRMSLWDVKTRPTISRGSCEAIVLLTFGNPCYKIRCNCGTCFHVSELHHTIWTPSKLEVLSIFWHAISHILS